MSDQETKADAETRRSPSIRDFENEPTRRLGDWRWLFATDTPFPIRTHRGAAGRAVVWLKRLLRPLVRLPQNDLWDRQRIFNLILLEHLEELVQRTGEIEQRMAHVEELQRQGLEEVMAHNDALFSRVDQKLDRYRRLSKRHTSALQAALASIDEAGDSVEAGEIAATLQSTTDSYRYLEFENRYRGTSEEIRGRLTRYVPYLEEKSPLLDLGCGRGEALALFRDHGLVVSGIDPSPEMVRQCRTSGLDVRQDDALQALASAEAGSLGSLVSFHVVEHLAARDLDRLVDLAWQALRPGGVLILETPNPRSLVVGASRFWIDATHLRPVHPEALSYRCTSAGFESVEVLSLHPFEAGETLPEVSLGGLESVELARLADRVNRLRDRLDDLLYGDQDFAVLAVK